MFLQNYYSIIKLDFSGGKQMKKVVKNNKGITIIALVVTVVILLILTGTVIYNSNLSKSNYKYNKMIADLNILSDKILNYYKKYNELPKTERKIDIDEVTYWEIDLSKLDNLTLNFGKDYRKKWRITIKQIRCLCNKW